MTYESKSPTDVGIGSGKKYVARRPVAVAFTIEDRLEAKAALGDAKVFSGPSLDEMSREQRHALLYGK